MRTKVIFMGTPHIAVPSLKALVDAGLEVPLVVSQPDKPKGRGGKVQHTPVKEMALSLGIEVYQPEKIKNNPEALEKLASYKADFFAVVAYGKILPAEILNLPKHAPINVHFSLLPLYRGAAPVNWAIYNGDEYTGVSTMKMDVGMDTGDILLMEKTPVNRKNAVDIADELSHTGAELLVKSIKEYTELFPVKQNNSEASHAPMMSKADGLIHWGTTAVAIERKMRAFVPWPCAYTYLDGKLLKLFCADTTEQVKAGPGEIYNVTKTSFTVGTGEGGLIVKELQLEGKRRMTVQEFLTGYKLKGGEIFG